jgi:adenosylcobinamide-phosphate synthase
MGLTAHLLAALALDLLWGDPRWFPHPVRFIGRFALALEAPLRRFAPTPRVAGISAVVLVVGTTAAVTWSLLALAELIHPWLNDLLSVLLLWTTFALRDLRRHSRAVWYALVNHDLPEARRRVSWLVGRDTAELDEPGVVRATVESVAENTVDGITAPLLFAALGGPVGAMVYKAINTLDSTFGYKNERYLEFGWASARLDDLANWLPARVTGPLMVVASALLRLNPWRAYQVMVRDYRRHPSPNAGWTEAALAGALGVRLGGPSTYGGVTSQKPYLGDGTEPLAAAHIVLANRLMVVTTASLTVLVVGLRWLATVGS